MSQTHHGRPRRRSLLAAALAVLVTVFANEGRAAAQEVHPFVDCVKVERRGQTQMIVYFGYNNSGSEAVTLNAGSSQNFILPIPTDAGQLSVFEPGEHHFAFTLYRPVSKEVWSLQGHKAMADGTSLPCQSYLFYRGDWVSGTFYHDGDVVSFDGRYYQAISFDTSGPLPAIAAVALTPEENAAEWQAMSPAQYAVMNLPGSGGSGSNVILSTAAYTFPRNGRLTIADARITADIVVQVEYVGGNLVPGIAVDITAGKFTAIGLPGKQFRYLLIH